jgi:hypothetical protein
MNGGTGDTAAGASARRGVRQAGYREYLGPHGQDAGVWRLKRHVGRAGEEDLLDSAANDTNCAGPTLTRLLAEDLSRREWTDETVEELAEKAQNLGLLDTYRPQITACLGDALTNASGVYELTKTLELADRLAVTPPGSETLTGRVIHLAENTQRDYEITKILALAERLNIRGRMERILRERTTSGYVHFKETLGWASCSAQSALHRWSEAETLPDVRRTLLTALEHPDLPEPLHHDMSLEAVACAALLYADGKQAGSRATARVSRHLEEHAVYLSAALGSPHSVSEIVSDSRLRPLLVRLIRHEQNIRSILEQGASSRASRAEKLFAASWAKQTGEAADCGATALAAAGHTPFRPTRACCDPQAATEEALSAHLATAGGNHSADPDIDEDDISGNSAKACLRFGCSCTQPVAQPSTGAPATAEKRADEIVDALAGRRPTRDLCDRIGMEAWQNSQLLLALLTRHRQLPNRLLAGIKRASMTTGDHANPNPPITAGQLCSRLGSSEAAALLTRLQSVRVQWEAESRPPRYLRYDRTRIEWRAAARFLIKDGAEAAWPAARSHGEDIEPAAARTLLRLGRLHTLWLDRELPYVIIAAAGYDTGRAATALKAAVYAPDGAKWPLIAALLCGDLKDADAEVVAKLAHTWDLDSPGALEELISLAPHI